MDLPTSWTTTLKTSLQVCRFYHVPARNWEFRGGLIKALTFCSVPLFHSAFHLSTRIPILSSLLSAVCSTAGASSGSENHSTVYHKNLPCINDDATVGNNECPFHRTVQHVSAFSCLFCFNLRASKLSPWSDYWMDFFFHVLMGQLTANRKNKRILRVFSFSISNFNFSHLKVLTGDTDTQEGGWKKRKFPRDFMITAEHVV